MKNRECKFGRGLCTKRQLPGRKFCREHSELLDRIKGDIEEERGRSPLARGLRRKKERAVDEATLTSED